MVDEYGNTPFMLACKSKNIKLVKTLLEDETVDVNAKAFNGMTGFMMVCRSLNVELIKLLLSNNRIIFYLKDNHDRDAMNIIREECFRHSFINPHF
jgi:ankyrin repeat protein